MSLFYNKIKNALVMAAVAIAAVLPAYSQDFEYDGIRYSVIDKENKTCSTKKYVKSLPKSLIIPAVVSDSKTEYIVTEIGPDSFSGSDDLEEVSLPNTITKIGNAAFMMSNNLTSINLPESLVEIGDSAFYKCTDYYWHGPNNVARKSAYSTRTVVRIPNGVKKIGKRAFMSEVSRGSYPMVVPANIPTSLTEIEDYTFYCNPPEDMTMPHDLSMIGRWAFHGCHATDIVIPDNVTTIGEWAFSSSSIENVALPDNISEISCGLFYGCQVLSSVSIPEGVTKIGTKAFADTGLLSINIPDGVTAIGSSAFAESSLSSITMPSSITSIGDSAFLKTKVEKVSLPSRLNKVSDYLFKDCTKLKYVEIPVSVVSIGDYSFYNCRLQELSLPDGISSIGKYAFYCGNFTDIKLPNSLTSISEGAFCWCTGLETVALSKNMKEIPPALFTYCISLKSVSCPSASSNSDGHVAIPSGIEVIGGSAFDRCNSIKSVTVPASVRELSGNPFPGCKNLESFSVDRMNNHYRVEDGAILSIDGDTLVAYPGAVGGQYEIPASVKVIGKYSFSDNILLERVFINDGVVSINTCAFHGCPNLREVTFPNTLTFIGPDAFKDAPLTNIVLPQSVRTIKISAFGTKEPIESIRIYATLDEIWSPFNDCENVGKIYYLTKTPQGNSGDNMDWGIFPRWLKPNGDETPLYVLKEAYDTIVNGYISPWSKFKNIIIYDPTDDPYLSSLEEVSADIDFSLPVSVFTLSGVRVADSADNLPSGIYIVRQGAKAKKIAVN